ncbi:MAG: transcription-repair coupling factor [Phycisphaerales bacterium]|jgi:transcription-repair coupling factor (superfamily II helicase)|nr:transcription-repair coupling factor [Phycisphaerales bacterium]MDP7086958.1 transcription-repair coupling factor [Phycisphaerales bacterium]HJN80480.1 transcription-repair coupling factor [Phycisphaerales bacterium]|tara:strand:+ start:4001 stop:7234 length:3234 start_codon:yes stop_codon:yes gene_type:complete
MSENWYQAIDAYQELNAVIQVLSDGVSHISGRAGSSTAMVMGAIARMNTQPRLLVTAHLDQADETMEELQAQGVDVLRFPALETLPGETAVRSDLLAERLRVLQVIGDPSPPLIVAPIAAIMQPVPSPSELGDMLRTIRPGDQLDRAALLQWMDQASWARAATVERSGEYAVRGDVLDIFPEVGEPVRVDLFGDQVESLHGIDLDTMGSAQKLERLDLVAGAASFAPECQNDEHGPPILPELLDERWEAVLDDAAEIREQARAYSDRIAGGGWIAELETVQAALADRCRGVCLLGAAEQADMHLPIVMLPAFPDQATDAMDDLRSRSLESRVIVVCQQQGDVDRLRELLGKRSPTLEIASGYLHRGFVWHGDDQPIQFVPYHEIVHRYHVRRKRHGESARRQLDAFVEIAPGDFVVHRDHGIASFLGMQVQPRRAGQDDAIEEFLVLEFAAGARLLVPATGIDDVHRYIGAFKGKPERSMLGGNAWENRKGRAADSVRDLAAELLRVQAVRQERVGVACPPDGLWQQEFEAAFPWEETRDQAAAFTAVATDMQHPRPMDRLICGDVGFGKTEVAIRAAFRVAAAGRQAAVLVPTTVLAEQHERTFRNRFAGFPFRVESMSRFKTAAEQREILAELAAGSIDVLIGTHRLLSKDVHFKELGLVVIDEEQRFGVEHKQRLLQLRATVDVLTMTATPIPRTLHMSMMGLRDISSLQTAPVDRRAVVTEVLPWNEHRLRSAIQRELAREGQIFVVHNRVRDLGDVAEAVHHLVPDARIVTGHGQMPPKELEQTMLAFMRHEADVLVATTIIESGIDIPNANTIIINEADRFGLADLHQLRGRVGRSRHRAYCYLLLPMTRTVRPEARRRLQAVESFSMLGAGFRIALRDLELRGAGNLLGPEQSGHIAAVGYELYCRLLEGVVEDLKSGRSPQQRAPILDFGWTGYFPEAWIPGDARRLDAYRRLCQARTLAAIDQVIADLHSAYGPIPEPAARLRICCQIGVMLAAMDVRSLLRRDDDLVFQTSHPEPLLVRLGALPGKVRRVGERSAEGVGEVWWRPPAVVMCLESVASHLSAVLETSP